MVSFEKPNGSESGAPTNLPTLVVLCEVAYPFNYHDYNITWNTSSLITLLKLLLSLTKIKHSITCTSAVPSMFRIDILSSFPSQCQARTPVKRLAKASVWSHWPAHREALPWASLTSDHFWGSWCSFFPGRFVQPSRYDEDFENGFGKRELLQCQEYEVDTGWAIQFVLL